MKQVKELISTQLIVSFMSPHSYSFIHPFYCAAQDIELLEKNRKDRSLSLRWTYDAQRRALDVSDYVLEPCFGLSPASLLPDF